MFKSNFGQLIIALTITLISIVGHTDNSSKMSQADKCRISIGQITEPLALDVATQTHLQKSIARAINSHNRIGLFRLNKKLQDHIHENPVEANFKALKLPDFILKLHSVEFVLNFHILSEKARPLSIVTTQQSQLANALKEQYLYINGLFSLQDISEMELKLSELETTKQYSAEELNYLKNQLQLVKLANQLGKNDFVKKRVSEAFEESNAKKWSRAVFLTWMTVQFIDFTVALVTGQL